jgi:anti-sigma B factor antagonist
LLSDRFIPPRFECLVEPDRDRVLVRPKGELDMATVPEVDRQIEEVTSNGFKQVVLDLSGLTFLDSTGLRLLIKWTQRCRQDGIDFSVLPGGPQVDRVLEISGIRPELTFADPNNIRRG